MKVAHIARKFLAAIFMVVSPTVACASTVAQPYPIVPHSTASSSQVQSDFGALYNTINGYLDASNLASGSGIYANQIVPTNTAQGVFGGSQLYTFPSSVQVNGGVTTNGLINNAPTTLNGDVSVIGHIAATNYISGTTIDSAYSATQGIYYAGQSNASQLDYNVSNTGEWTFTAPLAVNGFANISGQIVGGSTISGKTNGASSQVLPVVINAATFTGSANAHLDAFTVGSTGSNFSGVFGKPFDTTPICTISSNTTNGYIPSITPVSATVFNTGNTISGILYNIVCVGS